MSAPRGGSPCFLLLEDDGKYTRVHPKKKGTFDCDESNFATVQGPPIS